MNHPQILLSVSQRNAHSQKGSIGPLLKRVLMTLFLFILSPIDIPNLDLALFRFVTGRPRITIFQLTRPEHGLTDPNWLGPIAVPIWVMGDKVTQIEHR